MLEVVESSAQLVKHAPRNEGGGSQLGIGVLKLLSGTQAEILVDADVAEAGIALQVLNALRCQQKELLDLGIIGLPKLTVVLRVLDQQFVGTQRRHAVVETLTPPIGSTLNVINRLGMDHGARRPWAPVNRGPARDLL